MRFFRRLICLVDRHRWVPFRTVSRCARGTFRMTGRRCSRCGWNECRARWAPRSERGRLFGLHLMDQFEAKAVASGATVRRVTHGD